MYCKRKQLVYWDYGTVFQKSLSVNIIFGGEALHALYTNNNNGKGCLVFSGDGCCLFAIASSCYEAVVKMRGQPLTNTPLASSGKLFFFLHLPDVRSSSLLPWAPCILSLTVAALAFADLWRCAVKHQVGLLLNATSRVANRLERREALLL